MKVNAPVGKNMHDHIYTAMFFQFHQSTATSQPSADILNATYNLAVHDSGKLTEFGVSSLTAFVNTQNRSGYPDFQLRLYWFPKNGWEIERFVEALNYKEHVADSLRYENTKADMAAVLVTLLQPKSVSGFIELKSSSPFHKPRIVPNYFSDAEDMQAMLRAVKHQLSFEDTESYRDHEGKFLHIPIRECDRFAYRSDNYLRCYIKYFSATLYHPVATSNSMND